jgi:hypothetical protein
MQTYKINTKDRESLERYKSGLETNAIIEELQLANSRISDNGVRYMAIGDCPSCPECLCADFLGKEFGTAAGIIASTPALLACKVASVVT